MYWQNYLYDKPVNFYAQGDLDVLKKQHSKVAIVGTRYMTKYAQNCLNLIVPELVRNNIVIVSGGALGVDIEAQKIAFALGGKTITVLGSGLKVPTPKTNISYFTKFIKQGVLVSEFPPDMPAFKYTFVQRNRIISAIADVVLVVEASEKSGALITADFALEQGKYVCAIPGPIFAEKSAGTNMIIRAGADLISRPEQILYYFNL